MESIISFLITIAFYAFIFRVIKRLAGKGKKTTTVQKTEKTITFTNKTGTAKPMSGLMKGLLDQTGLSQIMESIEQAQRMQKEKLENAVNAQQDYETGEDEDFVDEPVYAEPQRYAPAAATTQAQNLEEYYNYSSPTPTNKVIEGKDLKKAIIYSEIIAPPLAFRQ